MKPGDSETKAMQRAKECADAIRRDADMQRILCESLANYGADGADQVLDNIAGSVAGLHFVLPLEAGKERYERRATMQRAIKMFRDAIDTFQRQSGVFLPSPSDVLYRETPLNDVPDYIARRLPALEVDHYLGCLDEYLHDADGGTWVHPFLATETNQWPRTPAAAVRIWIIRTLDSAGVPRITQQDKDRFLALAVRLVDLLEQSLSCAIDLTRKSFTDDRELRDRGRYQWRGLASEDK